MVRREPPETDEGWYALHDLRTIDWTAWRDAPQRVRDRATDEATEFLTAATEVADAPEGASVVYAVTGHESDLMVVHLRPTLDDVELLERRFERTDLAGFTERTESFVSVTEASGYSERAREYFEGELDDDAGLATYMRSRLYPQLPDHEYVSFYPMDKRRHPEQNWYDLPFDERADHVDSHGDIGRDYAGQVTQMITGAIGLDDWEWGVTLWTDDLTDVKDLLYEMRFDPSTSKFAEFGPFYVGRRLPPADLGAYLAGERLPTDGAGSDGRSESAATTAGSQAESASSAGAVDEQASGEASARPPTPGDETEVTAVDDIDHRLAAFGVTAEEYDEGDHGLVCYVEATAEDVVDDIEGLRENFDHYDTHVLTRVRANQGEAAVVSVWETDRAATTAAGFLTDIDAVSRTVRGRLGEEAAGADADASRAAGTDEDAAAAIREDLADQDVYAGQPHGEDVYALVLYSRADPDELLASVEDLTESFDRYDTHVKTAVYSTEAGLTTATDGSSGPDDSPEADQTPDDEVAAVVSLWESADAAEKAADFLTDLPDVVGRPADREGFTTLGMFYTVKSEYRSDFLDTFDDVADHLSGMTGHRETGLLVNCADADDMFIASRWDEKESAMVFFRSEAFRETVDWGREVLADEPRHVFFV